MVKSALITAAIALVVVYAYHSGMLPGPFAGAKK